MILLHGPLQGRSLLSERCRPHHVAMRSEEPLRTTIAHSRRCRWTPAGREALTCRNYRQITRHHPRPAQLLRPRRYRPRHPCPKVTGIDRRHGSSDVYVVQIVQRRKPHSVVQRSDSAKPVDVHIRDVDVPDIHHAKPSAVSSPPWMEPITRPKRQPSKAAPASEASSEAEAPAPAPE